MIYDLLICFTGYNSDNSDNELIGDDLSGAFLDAKHFLMLALEELEPLSGRTNSHAPGTGHDFVRFLDILDI